MLGWEQGESEPMRQEQETQILKKKPRDKPEKSMSIQFLDIAVLFQIPDCVSKLGSGTSVLQYTV